MTFSNVYQDARRAEAYASLEFGGTYYLAYRDLPAIIHAHVTGRTALDFGCGAGRSTRFLKHLGFDVIGVDISADMLAQARSRDPGGSYRLADGNGLADLPAQAFDLVLAAYPFDNIPTADEKVRLFALLRERLAADGRLLNLVSTPEVYLNEWMSFTTREFPENHAAKSGDIVRVVMTDVDDRRPVEDILFTDEDYRRVYDRAGLSVIALHKPLGKEHDPYDWVSEHTVAPWAIYVLARG